MNNNSKEELKADLYMLRALEKLRKYFPVGLWM